METCFENKTCSWSELIQALLFVQPAITDEYINKMIFVGSGKAAIGLILEYLRKTGALEDKNSQVMVPKWVGYWVYNVMQKRAFPCLDYNQNVRVMLVYHQYGFPQRMDEIMDFAEQKNIIVIEDCAHVFESYYRGKRVGGFGLASIYSFPKMFSTFMGGSIFTKDHELARFISGKIANDDSFVSHFSLFAKILADKFPAGFIKSVEMSYPLYDRNTKINRISLNLLKMELGMNSIVRRKQNYLLLLDYFKDYDIFQGLEKDVVPYVVPLIADESSLNRINIALNDHAVKTDIYHFDINRNLLNPQFKKCVWVPIHQGIDAVKMNEICGIIKGAIDQ
jgi:DegT/DnrJ/EryC1/StrS aminotransferase family